MSNAIVGDQVWAEMTEGQKVEAVLAGRATLKQMSDGLLDGSDQLRNACREFLAEADSPNELTSASLDPVFPKGRITRARNRTAPPAQRFGLPENFVPRLQRYGRSVLLELNIYRLPNGEEFIPCHPTGTLGTRCHLYALLTSEQYIDGKRGSVYVRTDGRIFDYSVDTANPSGDLFDTGYTIHDLERTGRYAPELRRRTKRKKKKKTRQQKYRLAAAS